MNRSAAILFLCTCFTVFSCKQNSENTTSKKVIAPKGEMQVISEKIKTDSENAILRNDRALLHLNNDHLVEALKDIQKSIQIDSTNPAYYCTLSDIYFAGGQGVKCISSLKIAVDLSPSDPKTLLRLAELFYYYKDYDQAFLYTNKAIKIDKLNPKAFFIKGMAYKEKGDTTKAITAFQQVFEIEPSHYDSYMQLGLIYMKGNHNICVHYFENALLIQPNSIEALYALAMYFQQISNFKEAIKNYNAILAISPKHKESHYNIGFINLEHLKKYNEAIINFSEAIKCEPQYIEAHFNRGLCCEQIKDYEMAKNNYQKALSLQTNYEPAIEALNRITANN